MYTLSHIGTNYTEISRFDTRSVETHQQSRRFLYSRPLMETVIVEILSPAAKGMITVQRFTLPLNIDSSTALRCLQQSLRVSKKCFIQLLHLFPVVLSIHYDEFSMLEKRYTTRPLRMSHMPKIDKRIFPVIFGHVQEPHNLENTDNICVRLYENTFFFY